MIVKCLTNAQRRLIKAAKEYNRKGNKMRIENRLAGSEPHSIHATESPPKDAVKMGSHPITELIIKNFPNPLQVMGYSPQDYEINLYVRMRSVLIRMGLSDKLIIMDNPFSHRAHKWMTDNSKFDSFNSFSTAHSNITYKKVPEGIQGQIELDLFPRPSIVKLEDGIYFFAWVEDFIDHGSKSNWIVFDMHTIKTHTQEEARIVVEKFIMSFSEKLRWIKTDEEIARKENTFDSIFLPENILTDIREDIESFLKSRKIYKEELELAWKRGYMQIGRASCRERV